MVNGSWTIFFYSMYRSLHNHEIHNSTHLTQGNQQKRSKGLEKPEKKAGGEMNREYDIRSTTKASVQLILDS